jgi:hypothetical protein
LTVSTIPPERDTGAVGFGLCDTCVHQQIVRNTRGSVFSLCRRSRDEPEFPRYPRVPVLACRGHELPAGADDSPGGGVPDPA